MNYDGQWNRVLCHPTILCVRAVRFRIQGDTKLGYFGHYSSPLSNWVNGYSCVNLASAQLNSLRETGESSLQLGEREFRGERGLLFYHWHLLGCKLILVLCVNSRADPGVDLPFSPISSTLSQLQLKPDYTINTSLEDLKRPDHSASVSSCYRGIFTYNQ